MSQYINIDGIVYKKNLLELAKQMVEGKQERNITLKEIQKLFAISLDFGFVTHIERQSLGYIGDIYELTESASAWLAQRLALESPTQRAVKRVIWEAIDLPGMQWFIDEEEVTQQEKLNPELSFQEILYAMLDSFLFQMESSESPRDIVSLELDKEFDDRDELTKQLATLMKRGSIYLFPENYMDLIKKQALPFSEPGFTHDFDKYWTFGMLLHDITNWQFIGFVRRTDTFDTYNTGWRLIVDHA